MPTEHINPPGVAAPNLYTQVVSTDGRRTVYVSGQIAVDTTGNVVQGDFQRQADQVFENLKVCLEAAGAGFGDVGKLTYYVVNLTPEDRTVILGLRQRYLVAEKPPASTLVGVGALARPDARIEIEAVAVLP
jgi:enamine deaminase RidA (YjgF/YER057c/UK114 family)